MQKRLNIIHIILVVLDVIAIPVSGFLCGWSTPAFFVATLSCVAIIHPLLYLIMMLVREFTNINNETPRYAPACMVLTLLAGCLVWYLFFHLEFNFAQTIGLWYGSVLLVFAIPMIVTHIMDKVIKKEDETKGPKIIRNRR